MAEKTAKVITRRKKFLEVDVPSVKLKVEIIGNSPSEIENRTIKLDLTRQLKGKSLEAVFKIKLENNKPVAYPNKIKLMSYFIRRMIRKRISYVEDSFETPSQESMLIIKPFLITRKRVSRAVRKTIRNKAKKWIEDYVSEKKDYELFNEILSNRFQKTLSLVLKKTYPLSLCEIRILEIKRPLKPEEVPEIKEKPKKSELAVKEEIIDQLEEIEREKIKQAEKEIKQVQEKAAALSKLENFEPSSLSKLENFEPSSNLESTNLESSDSKESEPATTKKPRKSKKKTEETEKKEENSE